MSNILDRGVVEAIPRKYIEEKLKSGKKLKIKFGVDPTGSDLHIGHMVAIRKLREFQDLGHTIQLVFGNFTGQIGDPTGKLSSRPPRKQEELVENAKTFAKQAGIILDMDKVEIMWNADWLSKLNFADVIKLAKTFTAAQMLERDMFQKRIEKSQPIYMHEFFYPLMQGYDSVVMKSDIEIGGTDQTFNMLAGREIQKAYDVEQQGVISVPILVGTDGTIKMGKSTGNYIGVLDEPNEMFGKVMSIPDDLIMNYFELATNVTESELKEIEEKLKAGENPRNLKVQLAKEIVKIYHSEKDADDAEQYFIQLFSKKQLPTDIEQRKLDNKELGLIDLIFEVGFAQSKSEARRLIQGGGVKINDKKITEIYETIDLKEEVLLQVGKRKFIKVQSS